MPKLLGVHYSFPIFRVSSKKGPKKGADTENGEDTRKDGKDDKEKKEDDNAKTEDDGKKEESRFGDIVNSEKLISQSYIK